MFDELLGALHASALATALRDSRTAYPVVNALHIMAIGTLFGAIVALDLRLLGVARAVLPLRPLARYLPRVAGSGLALALLTGALLFSVQPFDYLGNRAFLVKLALVAAGVLHAAAVHAGASWRRLMLGPAGLPAEAGAALKASAVLSLAVWIAAILAGRFIAF